MISRWLVPVQSVFEPETRIREQKEGGKVKLPGRNLEADVTSKNRQQLFGGVGPQKRSNLLWVSVVGSGLYEIKRVPGSSKLSHLVFISLSDLIHFGIHG